MDNEKTLSRIETALAMVEGIGIELQRIKDEMLKEGQPKKRRAGVSPEASAKFRARYVARILKQCNKKVND